MKLYWGSGSPVSWRVQIALALKGIEYESHRLDLGAREHRGDAYRAINPLGTFPVLVDGDSCIRESLAILAYLEWHTPQPALFGDVLPQVASIWQQVLEHESHLGGYVNTLTQALFRDGGLDDPEPAQQALSAACVELAKLDVILCERDWLIGATPSALEVVHYPTIHRFQRAAAKSEAERIGLPSELLRDEYAALFAWLQRFASVPGVDATYPPHWRQ